MKETKTIVATKEKFKKLIKSAQKKGLVKSHVEAFKEIPVKEEKHQGKNKYFLD